MEQVYENSRWERLPFPVVAGSGATPMAAKSRETQRRHAHDRRHWMERFRCLFEEAQLSAIRRRTSTRWPRKVRLHHLVRPGELHCGPRLVYDGSIPIRSALSIVVAPGDENYLRPETPTIAEFFKKNGYTTYFSASGTWATSPRPTRSRMASTK